MGILTSTLKVTLAAGTFVTVAKGVDKFASGEYGKGIVLMTAGVAMGAAAYAMAHVSLANEREDRKSTRLNSSHT